MNRRDLLKASAAGVLGLSTSSWLSILAARASETRQQTKNCILLWLAGGASTKDMWDLRPGTDNGGPFRQIQTNVNGIHLCEHLPRLAQHADKLALVR